jgi:hypothetical protein
MRELTEHRQWGLSVRTRLDEADPIWGETASVYETFDGAWLVLSDRSGDFKCGSQLRGELQGWTPADRAKLVTWINNHNRMGEEFAELWLHNLKAAKEARPLRYSEKIDGLMRHLIDRDHRPGDIILPPGNSTNAEVIAASLPLMKATQCVSAQELYGLIRSLTNEGILAMENERFILAPAGFRRMEMIDVGGASTDQAFVAMWFSADVDDAFIYGIEPGLNDAGFRAFRIDRKEHSNKIDDEIIAEIKRSRFLVADFTCGISTDKDGAVTAIARGGVYYEAGFAQGLNMPVIWTVREDQIGLVHFDTRQFNHITWSDPADLKVKLTRRVLAVLGTTFPA